MQSPHDQLFHYAFGQPDNAADLLRSTLPEAIAAEIDWSTLVRCDARLTDDEDEGLFADLVFRVTVAGTDSFLLTLLEHKSRPRRFTPLQVLRYELRLWELHRREHPEATSLPPILAVVVHHGRTPWQGPRSLRELIAVDHLPPAMASAVLRQQPDFTFHLDDLATQTEAQLTSRVASVLGQLALLCMQFLRDADEEEAEAALRRWRGLLATLHAAAEARDAFVTLIEYIATITDLRRGRLQRIFAAVHPDAEDTVMQTYGRLQREALQEGLAQGRAEGEARGKAEGEAKGKAERGAEILLGQLTARFGHLDTVTTTRVRSAEPAEIERWAIAVLTAPTLAAVFAPA